MSGWRGKRLGDSQTLRVAVRGREEVNSDRAAVKMTTNDGTTKALLQRFIDKEDVRESLLCGGHLLWGLLLSARTAGHANLTEMSSLSRPRSLSKAFFHTTAGKECCAVFESRDERRRSDIISYFPRNSLPHTHTHMYFPSLPERHDDDDDRLSVNSHRDTATVTSEALYAVTACHTARTIPATPEHAFTNVCLHAACVYTRRSPAGLGDDHFCSQLVELVPQVLVLQVALDAGQVVAVAAAFQVVGEGIGSRVSGGRGGRRRAAVGRGGSRVVVAATGGRR